jgi:hypothetical protein
MHINLVSPFAVSVKHRREKSEICEILPENVISCQAAPNGAQQEKRPSEKPLGMSRKKFSNGGGQESAMARNLQQSLVAMQPLPPWQNTAGAGGRKVLTKRKSK